jgi:hypothetical protein
MAKIAVEEKEKGKREKAGHDFFKGVLDIYIIKGQRNALFTRESPVEV